MNNIIYKGAEIDDWIVEDFLAKGGMGCEIWKVKNENGDDKEYALKFLNLKYDGLENDHISRFKKEIEYSKNFKHPNLLKYINSNSSKDYIYMISELVDGESLECLVENNILVDEKIILKYFLDISKALKYIWEEHDMLHRDVTIDNIIIDMENDRAVLLDLGILKSTDMEVTAITMEGFMVGTPLFLAPEYILEDECDFRSDMYSLGVCLFFTFSNGEYPVKGSSIADTLRKIIKTDRKSLSEINSDLDEEIVDIVDTMIRTNQDCRFDSWDALIARLETYLGIKSDNIEQKKKGLLSFFKRNKK